MKVVLPPLENLVSLASDAGEVSQHLQHNVLLWRWVNGAFGMLKDETLPFDTQQDYWYQTHRRFAAAYLHRRLRESYYPAADVRALAQHLFRHFERASASGALGKFALVQESEWPEYRGLFAAAARELGNPPEYERLKVFWKRLKGATLRDDVLEFYRGIEELASPNEFEPAFFYRMQWLPYVGVEAHGGELARWQRLFFAFYTLFASTNAFQQGGGMSFAPILQNNPLQLLLGHVRRWANGERPDRIGFRVESRWEERDCSHHVPVLELYGFLNLHAHPFHNGVNAETYAAFGKGENDAPIDQLEAVGAWTGRFLDEHPEAVSDLAPRFRKRVAEAAQPPWLWMEGVSSNLKAAKEGAKSETRVDGALQAELGEKAIAKAREWDDRKAAAALLHLAIDAFIYMEHKKQATVVPPEVVAEPVAAYGAAEPSAVPAAPRLAVAPLPEVLRAAADEALGFLKDGHHVLLAGAPGTGKTTVALTPPGHPSTPSAGSSRTRAAASRCGRGSSSGRRTWPRGGGGCGPSALSSTR